LERIVWYRSLETGVRLLRSRRFAILLLVAFLAACLLGNLGLPVFQSGWFLALTALLVLSSFACTLTQFTQARWRHRAAGRFVAGHWSSPLFHLGLVLLLATVAGSGLVGWRAKVVLSEGEAFDPAKQPLHGLTGSALVPAPSPDRLPRLRLAAHFPRHQKKGYAPDAASELLVNGERRLLFYGAPLRVKGVTLRQDRRYGALAEVMLRPAEAGEGGVSQTGEAPPPSVLGGLFRLADGSYRAGLAFVNQPNAEQQRRDLFLEPLGVTAGFQLVPGPAAARYDLPLDRRFALAVTLSPPGPAGSESASERRLPVGGTLPLGQWTLEFRSLRYWTTFSLSVTPLTPLVFAFAWWCVLALGLGLAFSAHRKEEKP
jgi:hypothetical protein